MINLTCSAIVEDLVQLWSNTMVFPIQSHDRYTDQLHLTTQLVMTNQNRGFLSRGYGEPIRCLLWERAPNVKQIRPSLCSRSPFSRRSSVCRRKSVSVVQEECLNCKIIRCDSHSKTWIFLLERFSIDLAFKIITIRTEIYSYLPLA